MLNRRIGKMNDHNDDVDLAPHGFASDLGGIFASRSRSTCQSLGNFKAVETCASERVVGLDIGRWVGRDGTVGAMGIHHTFVFEQDNHGSDPTSSTCQTVNT